VLKVKLTTVDHAQPAAPRVDFTGTSEQRPHQFQRAGLGLQGGRALRVPHADRHDIPMNDGVLQAARSWSFPEGSMLNPRYPAAVVAGNVETSRRYVTDALYGALGVMSAAQGTMNNFTFGNDRASVLRNHLPAGPERGPASTARTAVQTHMTNSASDRSGSAGVALPVLVDAISIRRGSGGARARNSGGDGVVRRIGFREPMTATLLSNRRRVAPFGLAGGGVGKLGAARVERADGSVQVLGATDAVQVAAGDAIVIETPGGGGYGAV
jgi:5-oxoprolinase (ATP-hydrolysing)